MVGYASVPRSTTVLLALCAALAAGALAASAAGGATPRPALDLRVTSVTGVPVKAEPGGVLRLRYAVARAGALRALTPTTRFYLSFDRIRSSSDSRLTGSARARIGRSGRLQGTVALRIPAATPTSGYYVIACVDDLRAIRERDERNNCRASVNAVTLSRKPSAAAVAAPSPPAAPAPAPAAPA